MSMGVMSQIERHEKRVHRKTILERSKTPQSVVERNIKNFRASSYAKLINIQKGDMLNTPAPTDLDFYQQTTD